MPSAKKKIFLLANNWVGLAIAKYLVKRQENIVGLAIHEKDKQKFTKEIIKTVNLPKSKIFKANSLRDPKVVGKIKQMTPDIMIGAFWGYILKSELEGNVYFQNDWSNNQSVNKGDLLFIITPVKNSRYIANLKIGSQDIRKVKVGQQVNIQLDSYPDYEYGVLQGTVKTISSISNRNGFYLIDVSLPKKLITSNNTIINFKEELSGKAEIITADIRLIERFFISLNKL